MSGPPAATVGSERLHQLDGLRGVAALVVVFSHYFAAMAPALTADVEAHPHWIADLPLAVAFNGPFAVVVFFVLSGFVVSKSVARRSDPLALTIGLRYLRLTLPAVASVLIAWALLRLFPTSASQLHALGGAKWLLYTHNGDIPSFAAAVKDGLYGIYRWGLSDFNNVLWTMRAELVGSVAIYLVYALLPHRHRVAALVATLPLIALLGQPLYYCAFSFGALMQEAWSAGRLPRVMPALFIGVGLLLGSQGAGFADRYGFDDWPELLQPGNKEGALYALAATFVVYGCLASRSVARLLTSRACLFLGRISFGLYLIHVPLLMTLFAAAGLALWPLSTGEIMVGLVAVVAASLVAGWAVTLSIDELVLRLLTSLRGRVRARLAPRASAPVGPHVPLKEPCR
jgi:peptidoglycan/LPS O-acetylase OafA/YrhL